MVSPGPVTPAARALSVPAAAALLVDTYVHLNDAPYYAHVGNGVLTQAMLFRGQAAVAAAVALLLLARPRRAAWALAFAVTASALTAVLLYRYVDVGALGLLPDMYEPTWDVPGKVLSAAAEASATVLTAAGVLLRKTAADRASLSRTAR
jgi:hypothetical protein